MKADDTNASTYEFDCDPQGVWRVIEGHSVVAMLTPGKDRHLLIIGTLPARTVLELLQKAGIAPKAGEAPRGTERTT